MTEFPILRQQFLKQRKSMDADACESASINFLTQLKQLDLLNTVDNIGIYFSHFNELALTPAIAWLLKQNKTLFAPILHSHKQNQLWFAPLTDHTHQNRFGIEEPPFSTQTVIAPWELDLVLVPLVGFTLTGFRLGMGCGYYDRSFAFKKFLNVPFLIGCAYHWQEIQENVVPHEWDIALDVIVTDRKIHYVISSTP